MFSSIYIVPLYLSQIQDYNSLEIGEVLMWMGFPQLLILPFMPKLMQRFDNRYLAGFGFFMFGVSYYMNCHMTVDFAGPQLIASMVVRAIGQPFIMVPIGMLATAHISKAENASASTVLNVIRNLGGAVGIALVATLTDNLTRSHLAHIKETLPAVSTMANQYLSQSASMLELAGSDPVTASQQASALLGKTMTQQASIQAYNDVFFIMSALLMVAVVSVLSIRKPAANTAH